jgi:DNA-binding Lrp family transcriptional regulator
MAAFRRRVHNVALAAVPEVTEVLGVSGEMDLLVQVVARDADDLPRIAGLLLAIDGVERTATSLVMCRLVDYRVDPLLRRRAGRSADRQGPARLV